MNFRRPIILASKSPRRQQLLKDAGFNFEVISKDVDESYPEEIDPLDVAPYLSHKKADAFMEELGNSVLITADTVVKVDNKILAKPIHYEEAKYMLELLSERTHEVITGVTIKDTSQIKTFSDITEVTFKALSLKEIDHYITNYSPFDKAGAYGIQEWIGMIGITKIKGSYFNVVGLPIQKLYSQLINFQS